MPMIQALVEPQHPAQSFGGAGYLCTFQAVHHGFLPAKPVFPALSRHANKAPMTSDRVYLQRCERKQQDREGEVSFWKHENF